MKGKVNNESYWNAKKSNCEVLSKLLVMYNVVFVFIRWCQLLLLACAFFIVFVNDSDGCWCLIAVIRLFEDYWINWLVDSIALRFYMIEQ